MLRSSGLPRRSQSVPATSTTSVEAFFAGSKASPMSLGWWTESTTTEKQCVAANRGSSSTSPSGA